MGKKSNHVVTNPSGGWSVKKSGADKAARTFNNKDKAVVYAIKISKREGSEVVIHGRDGRIRDKSSYGNDPYPPKDRKH